ncbi:7TM diverse intracellular signaling domain-containing protein [Nibrella viscosa]
MTLPSLFVSVTASSRLTREVHYQDLVYGLFHGMLLIIALYSLILGIRLSDRDNLLYAIWLVLVAVLQATNWSLLAELPVSLFDVLKQNWGVTSGIFCIVHILFTLSFLQTKTWANGLHRLGIGLLVLFSVCCILLLLFLNEGNRVAMNVVTTNLFTSSDGLFGLTAGLTVFFRGFKPAIFYSLGTLVLSMSLWLFLLSLYGGITFTFWTLNCVLVGSAVEVFFFLLGLTYKINLLKQRQEEAVRQQLQLSVENQQLIETQNRVLEEKVEQRTAELKASQAQLIQKEKLASLGELTAGIAHEIQNPLNFVNNLSEVSQELVEELEEERRKEKRDEDLETELISDLKETLHKVTHHGKRADSIVKGMLQHSRASTGEKQPTDLNQLADEYLRLAYQNLRAKDQSFTADLRLKLDPALGQVNIAPQDMGRVLLNLYNNAFYAVQEKAKGQEGYQPQVTVSTQANGGKVELRVADNGTGIPQAILDKIYQPFFTTKPTGEGTGLGLSLSYDIITKGHGGTMEVESREGEGAEFVVSLPA